MRRLRLTPIAISLALAAGAAAVAEAATPACAPGGAPVTVAVSYEAADVSRPLTVIARIDYPADQVTMPAGEPEAALKRRVEKTPKGSTFVVTNMGGAIRLALTGATSLEPGDFATVKFDRCRGATVPPASAFTCTVEAASERSLLIRNARCSVRVVE